MFIFPYRAQIKLHKIPVMTIAVAVVCLLIYFLQSRNDANAENYVENFCARLIAANKDAEDLDIKGPRGSKDTCEGLFGHLYFSAKPEKILAHIVDALNRNNRETVAKQLVEDYRNFAAHAPVSLTKKLWHDRSRFDPIGMLTSSFSHGSWGHVIFNLIFFFAFAPAVELILGPVLFLSSIVLLSYGIGIFDFAMAQWTNHPFPSLGLSGVVMGMVGLFVYFLPRAKIRFFYWFMLSVGTLGIPAWFVGLWYFGGDLYSQLSGEASYVNFIAHISGAMFGLLIGFIFFRSKRHWAKDLVMEEVDLTKDESTFDKMNGIMAVPFVGGIAFLVGIFVIVLVFYFIHRFWVVLLMAAPAMLAGYQIYRSRQADRPKREIYELGIEALNRNEYQQARKYLEPLAEKNDTRALFALAGLYANGNGVVRDQTKAFDLYTRAATRGHGQSLYVLGSLYADGRGTPRNVAKAIECYEKAARAGVPDAANSLGYIYENGAGVPADQEKAIEWYYLAGVGYHKAKRMDDVQAILRHLDSVAAKFPAVLGSVAKLKALGAIGK